MQPFFRYYFEYYLPQKKTVVISLMTRMKLYDEELFLNFTSQLDQILAQARATELFNNGGNSQNLSTLNLQNIDKVVQ